MNDNKLVICYTDTVTNDQKYDVTSIDAQTWLNLHPSCEINFTFKANWDMTRKRIDIEHNFLMHHHEYNLSQSDLHKCFINRNGHTVEILGYKPMNTRYKFIIFDHDENKEYKVTPSYIKDIVANAGA